MRLLALSLTTGSLAAGGDFSILARADAANFEINYSTLSNPTKNGDFKMLVHEFNNVTYRGHHCLNAPDFTSVGAKVGDELTLQIVYNAGTRNTILYTCADIKLVEATTYTVPTGLGCFTGALDVATAATEDFGLGDQALASSASSSSSSSGLTAVSMLKCAELKLYLHSCLLSTYRLRRVASAPVSPLLLCSSSLLASSSTRRASSQQLSARPELSASTSALSAMVLR